MESGGEVVRGERVGAVCVRRCAEGAFERAKENGSRVLRA